MIKNREKSDVQLADSVLNGNVNRYNVAIAVASAIESWIEHYFIVNSKDSYPGGSVNDDADKHRIKGEKTFIPCPQTITFVIVNQIRRRVHFTQLLVLCTFVFVCSVHFALSTFFHF